MATKERKITYNDNDRAVVNALKENPNGLTLAQLREATGLNLVAGHIVSTMSKGLIAVIGETGVAKPFKSKVGTYAYANSNEKADGKPFTDGQKAVLDAIRDREGYFTLAELSDTMGTKVAPGVITSLVKNGNVVKGDQVEVTRMGKAIVKIYGFVADIPASAE